MECIVPPNCVPGGWSLFTMGRGLGVGSSLLKQWGTNSIGLSGYFMVGIDFSTSTRERDDENIRFLITNIL